MTSEKPWIGLAFHSSFVTRHLSLVICHSSFVTRHSLRGGSGAADNLDQLFGNARLPHLVCIERQVVDHLRGIPGGSVHGRHSGSMFRRSGFEKCAEDLRLDVPGKKAVEYLFRGLIVEVLQALGRVQTLEALDGEKWLDNDALLHNRFEFVVYQQDSVLLALLEFLDDVLRDGGGICEAWVVQDIDGLMPYRIRATPEVVPAPLSQDVQLYGLVLVFDQELECVSQYVGVVGAAEPLVGSYDQEFDLLIAALRQKRMTLLRNAGGQVIQNREHLLCVGACSKDALLGAAQPCGRDELHRAGDLLNVLCTPDPAPDVSDVRHGCWPAI